MTSREISKPEPSPRYDVPVQPHESSPQPGATFREQYLSECLANQAEVFARRGTPASELLAQQTITQCLALSNPYMRPDGSVAPKDEEFIPGEPAPPADQSKARESVGDAPPKVEVAPNPGKDLAPADGNDLSP